jgi:glycosyltransferase involved in cell wall biosynthesis
VRAVADAAQRAAADAVVTTGRDGLAYLAAVRGPVRVWYAADEAFWHHASQVQLRRPRTWGQITLAVVNGVYERAHRQLADRVWVVTEADRRAMRVVGGVRAVDVIPNGVDADHFAPRDGPQRERSCAFWGRLDFGPNVQALEWFCRAVWPRVRAATPDAALAVYGFNPTPAVRALAGRDGVELVPDLPDLRPAVAAHPVAVLPFVSGGGIKNKFLEAAAMGKAVVCSPTALNGLRRPDECGARVARSAGEWAAALAGSGSTRRPARRPGRRPGGGRSSGTAGRRRRGRRPPGWPAGDLPPAPAAVVQRGTRPARRGREDR